VAEADVWFGGVKTKQTGKEREFVTPPLEPGQKYKYQVRAVWSEKGVEGEYNRTVEFQAGQSVVVDFTQPGLSEKQPQPEKKEPKVKM
jgi:uncharacterized protein (TIGR03000 family)